MVQQRANSVEHVHPDLGDVLDVLRVVRVEEREDDGRHVNDSQHHDEEDAEYEPRGSRGPPGTQVERRQAPYFRDE